MALKEKYEVYRMREKVMQSRKFIMMIMILNDG